MKVRAHSLLTGVRRVICRNVWVAPLTQRLGLEER